MYNYQIIIDVLCPFVEYTSSKGHYFRKLRDLCIRPRSFESYKRISAKNWILNFLILKEKKGHV